MFEIEAKILDAQKGEFKNDEGDIVKYSGAVIQTDSGVHSVQVADGVDLDEFKGDDLEHTLIAKLSGSIKKPAKVLITGTKE